jgi:hypothetical protein
MRITSVDINVTAAESLSPLCLINDFAYISDAVPPRKLVNNMFVR